MSDIEEAGDSIEDIVAATDEVEWVGPTKICMIPEYYNFVFLDILEPFLKKIEEYKKKGEELRFIWLE